MAILERELDNAKAAAAAERARCETEGTKIPNSLTERGETVTVSRTVLGLLCFTGRRSGNRSGLAAGGGPDDDDPDDGDVGGGH